MIQKLHSLLLRFIRSPKSSKPTSASLAKFNIDDIIIPEYQELTPTDRAKVDALVNKFTTSDHEEIIHFGKDIAEKCDLLIHLLIELLEETAPGYFDKKNLSEVAQKIIDTKFHLGEFYAYIEAFHSLRQNTVLSIIAIGHALTDVGKHRYEFLGLLGSSAALKKLRLREALENLFVELSTTVRIIDIQIASTANTIRTDQSLIEVSNLAAKIKQNQALLDKENQHLKTLGESILQRHSAAFGEDEVFTIEKFKILCNQLRLISSRNKTEQTIIEHLARLDYKMKAYGLLHKNDYSLIINNIDDIIETLCSDCRYVEPTLSEQYRQNNFEHVKTDFLLDNLWKTIEAFRICCDKYVDEETKIRLFQKKDQLDSFLNIKFGQGSRQDSINCRKIVEKLILKLEDKCSVNHSSRYSAIAQTILSDYAIDRLHLEEAYRRGLRHLTPIEQFIGIKPSGDFTDYELRTLLPLYQLSCAIAVCTKPCSLDCPKRRQNSEFDSIELCHKRNRMITAIHEAISDDIIPELRPLYINLLKNTELAYEDFERIKDIEDSAEKAVASITDKRYKRYREQMKYGYKKIPVGKWWLDLEVLRKLDKKWTDWGLDVGKKRKHFLKVCEDAAQACDDLICRFNDYKKRGIDNMPFFHGAEDLELPREDPETEAIEDGTMEPRQSKFYIGFKK